MTTEDPASVMKALAVPFHPSEVKWKPQAVKGNRAMAICYVDARCVMDRLDAVFGVGRWQTSYTPFPGGSVECRLSVFLGGEWITKADVGSPSEQPDEGDQLKAAYSDALKRAAVQFGIGRYLYRLKVQWVDYDAAKRMFARTPSLPPEALPKNGEEGTLSDEEMDALSRLIHATDTNLDKFLAFASESAGETVESLSMVRKSEYKKLTELLKRKPQKAKVS